MLPSLEGYMAVCVELVLGIFQLIYVALAAQFSYCPLGYVFVFLMNKSFLFEED